MANQSPDRRQILEMLAKVAGIAAFPGFARWTYADQPPAAHPKPTAYRPRFFTPGQFAVVDRLAELILPADGTPGAHDAGVAEFIDFMAFTDRAIQQPFLSGLAALDPQFAELPEDRQIAILRTAAASHGPQREFFLLLRRYTVMGFYTSRIGLETLDYPGLKMYARSPECPHRDDPEHRHLQGAGA